MSGHPKFVYNSSIRQQTYRYKYLPRILYVSWITQFQSLVINNDCRARIILSSQICSDYNSTFHRNSCLPYVFDALILTKSETNDLSGFEHATCLNV